MTFEPLSNLKPDDSTFELREYRYPSPKVFERGDKNFNTQEFCDKSGAFKLPVLWSCRETEIIVKDLAEVKNLVIVGPPDSGKSTFIHQLVVSSLVSKHPSQLKFVFLDCKGIELTVYKGLERHFLARLASELDPIVPLAKNTGASLFSLMMEMDNRYDLLKDAWCKNIYEYNNKFVNRKLDPEKGHQFLPYIVLVIDELADLVCYGKDKIFVPLQRLISSGYKAGMYNILITNQYLGNSLSPSLVSMIEQRVVFKVHERSDYRRFLEGAKLDYQLNKGDFLFNEGHHVQQGSTICLPVEGIEEIVYEISTQPGYAQPYLLPELVDALELEHQLRMKERDPLFEEAARLIVSSQSGSTSLLQRRMKLGYHRAGLIMDQLEAAGIVGSNEGAKTRAVLISSDADLQELINKLRR